MPSHDQLGEVYERINGIERKLDQHINNSNNNHERVMMKMEGDGTILNPGLISITTEIRDQLNAQSVTTKKHKNPAGWESMKNYVYIGVGIIGTLSVIVPLVWPYVFPTGA